jgi:hypothetical protein
MNNPAIVIYDIFNKIVELFNVLRDFLFEEITLAGINFSVWQLLGGVGLVAILVLVLAKLIVPLV